MATRTSPSDSDSQPDGCDNCPNDYNPDQDNFDGDALGDVCDPDDDDDGILDDGDLSGTIGDNYCTGGEFENCDDNCQFAQNPDQADSDNNGIGDVCDGCCVGVVGNANCDPDEIVDITDITYLIRYLFIDPFELCCFEEADVNIGGEHSPDISDIVYLIDHLYVSHVPLLPCP